MASHRVVKKRRNALSGTKAALPTTNSFKERDSSASAQVQVVIEAPPVVLNEARSVGGDGLASDSKQLHEELLGEKRGGS